MRGIISRYRDLMPPEIQAISDDKIVTLGEGGTPLIRAKNLEEYLRTQNPKFAAQVWLKDEGVNPTKSFKDRGMTGAVSYEKSIGRAAVACASTGNTYGSAAAYAKKAGMKCFGLVPEGKVTPGKIFLASMYGATTIEIRGNFDAAFALVKQLKDVGVVNNIHPYRLCGQATAAFEICDKLKRFKRVPSYHFLPVGNAGNITAYWMGYTLYKKMGKIPFAPAMMGCQAEGAAAMVLGRDIENPETEASAIRIGKPARREEATRARIESGGRFYSVTDDEIKEARKLLVETEDVFCELASATSVATVIKLNRFGRLDFWKMVTVVCTLTGSGWKDLDTAFAQFIPQKSIVIEPKLDDVMDVIRSK